MLKKKDNFAAPLPPFIPPMMATLVDDYPRVGNWIYELKYDGIRAQAHIQKHSVQLISRNQKELAARFSEIAKAFKAFPPRTILDGEIVALDPDGRSSFELLQGMGLTGETPPIIYYVFDLLFFKGKSMLQEPIEKRKNILVKLFEKKNDLLRLSPFYTGDPTNLLNEVKKHSLEGILIKQGGSKYEPGSRSGTWKKLKVTQGQEFVIGGFSPPRKSRPLIGALLIGYYQEGKLYYACKVGTGFSFSMLKKLHQAFKKLQTDQCPFVNLPMIRKPRWGEGMTLREMRTCTWLKPKMVCQIQFSSWTKHGMLRQPVFIGLREDKNPKEVKRELIGTSPI